MIDVHIHPRKQEAVILLSVSNQPNVASAKAALVTYLQEEGYREVEEDENGVSFENDEMGGYIDNDAIRRATQANGKQITA